MTTNGNNTTASTNASADTQTDAGTLGHLRESASALPPARLRTATTAPATAASSASFFSTRGTSSSTRVGLGGLEPPASSLSGMRSNRLSYRPVNLDQRTWPPPRPDGRGPLVNRARRG